MSWAEAFAAGVGPEACYEVAECSLEQGEQNFWLKLGGIAKRLEDQSSADQ
jgi:hypothetical protein